MSVQRETLVSRKPPALAVIAVTIAVLACNMPALRQAAPTAPVQTVAAPPETPTPEPAEAVALDPCSLLTRAEVEAALGTPLGSDAANQLAACAYTAPGMALSLSAAQGEDAKGWLLAGLDLILLFLGDEQATQMREDIVANASSLSVGEVVRQSLPIYEIIGYQFQAASELGSEAFWGWSELGGGMLLVVEGETYLGVGVQGMGQDAARAAAVGLAGLVRGRLSARFTVPVEGEIHVEVTLPPIDVTLVPALTPEPVSAQIVSVECGPGLALNLHIQITSQTGILSYTIWSTWGGGGDIEQSFSPPLPTAIDETLVFEHENVDPEARNHQVGLSVVVEGVAEPVYAYGSEPSGRCPGH